MVKFNFMFINNYLFNIVIEFLLYFINIVQKRAFSVNQKNNFFSFKILKNFWCFILVGLKNLAKVILFFNMPHISKIFTPLGENIFLEFFIKYSKLNSGYTLDRKLLTLNCLLHEEELLRELKSKKEPLTVLEQNYLLCTYQELLLNNSKTADVFVKSKLRKNKTSKELAQEHLEFLENNPVEVKDSSGTYSLKDLLDGNITMVVKGRFFEDIDFVYKGVTDKSERILCVPEYNTTHDFPITGCVPVVFRHCSIPAYRTLLGLESDERNKEEDSVTTLNDFMFLSLFYKIFFFVFFCYIFDKIVKVGYTDFSFFNNIYNFFKGKIVLHFGLEFARYFNQFEWWWFVLVEKLFLVFVFFVLKARFKLLDVTLDFLWGFCLRRVRVIKTVFYHTSAGIFFWRSSHVLLVLGLYIFGVYYFLYEALQEHIYYYLHDVMEKVLPNYDPKPFWKPTYHFTGKVIKWEAAQNYVNVEYHQRVDIAKGYAKKLTGLLKNYTSWDNFYKSSEYQIAHKRFMKRVIFFKWELNYLHDFEGNFNVIFDRQPTNKEVFNQIFSRVKLFCRYFYQTVSDFFKITFGPFCYLFTGGIFFWFWVKRMAGFLDHSEYRLPSEKDERDLFFWLDPKPVWQREIPWREIHHDVYGKIRQTDLDCFFKTWIYYRPDEYTGVTEYIGDPFIGDLYIGYVVNWFMYFRTMRWYQLPIFDDASEAKLFIYPIALFILFVCSYMFIRSGFTLKVRFKRRENYFRYKFMWYKICEEVFWADVLFEVNRLKDKYTLSFIEIAFRSNAELWKKNIKMYLNFKRYLQVSEERKDLLAAQLDFIKSLFNIEVDIKKSNIYRARIKKRNALKKEKEKKERENRKI